MSTFVDSQERARSARTRSRWDSSAPCIGKFEVALRSIESLEEIINTKPRFQEVTIKKDK